MSTYLLNLRSDTNALGVGDAWQSALAKAEVDDVVQIAHAEISGNSDYRLHVASIADKVGCHFHEAGDEDYSVVSGQGTLYWGKVFKDRYTGEQVIMPELPIDVETGDSFVIPEGYAHQLKSTGPEELVIVFGCPDEHLSDDHDRTILPSLVP